MKKQHAADGKGDPSTNNGVTAKQEQLGGSPLTIFLKSGHTKVKGHKVNGEQFTSVTVRYSDEIGVKASKYQNRPCLLLGLAGLSNRSQKSSGSEEVQKMKNATLKLKTTLTDKIGMAQHPDNRKGSWCNGSGSDTYKDDEHPWYNMQMTFFFKGHAKKVGQYQQTVVTPSDEEVAMLVKKMDLAKKK